MEKTTFKNFLIEYSFKKVLPPNVQRIYPIHFNDEEYNAFKELDDGWQYNSDSSTSPKHLVNRFYKDRKYKNGTAAYNVELCVKRYRDRFVVTIMKYDDENDVNLCFKKPTTTLDPINISNTNLNHLKRKITNICNTHVFS